MPMAANIRLQPLNIMLFTKKVAQFRPKAYFYDKISKFSREGKIQV